MAGISEAGRFYSRIGLSHRITEQNRGIYAPKIEIHNTGGKNGRGTSIASGGGVQREGRKGGKKTESAADPAATDRS